jgi:hypothetical protein
MMKLFGKGLDVNPCESEVHAMNRETFSKKILDSTKGKILEIGPLNRPLVRNSQVMYFDLLPTALLRDRAEFQGLDPDSVPEIHFHDEQGDLTKIDRKFSSAVSAHCLEHQPDLISHLKQVSDLLEGNDSYYWVILPDKRYCFDALLSESKISEVVQSFEMHDEKPSIWKVIEHRALTTHNDPTRHWQGDHGEPNLDLIDRWQRAVSEYNDSNGDYIDVHCWQFTPKSFANLIDGLFRLGYIDFEVEEVFETPMNDLEFCVILRKN